MSVREISQAALFMIRAYDKSLDCGGNVGSLYNNDKSCIYLTETSLVLFYLTIWCFNSPAAKCHSSLTRKLRTAAESLRHY